MHRRLDNHQFGVVAIVTPRIKWLRVQAFSLWLHHSYFPAGRVIAAVFDRLPVFVQQLEKHSVLAIDPALQPDGFPLIDKLRFVIVNDISDAIVTTVTLQLCAGEPEVDHYWISVCIFIFTLGPAVG